MLITSAARRLIVAGVLAMLLLTIVAGPQSVLGESMPLCPAYDDIPTRHPAYTDWYRTLLDTIYRLPLSYKPPGLADTSRAGFSSGHLVRHRLIDDLRALGMAARAAGAPLDIQSAFRSSAAQAASFNYWLSVCSAMPLPCAAARGPVIPSISSAPPSTSRATAAERHG